MKLPILFQPCIITHNGERHLGHAESFGPDFEGRYRIGAYSRSWGYVIKFQSDDIELLQLKLADGTEYDAYAAFQSRYSLEEQRAMCEAESGGRAAKPVSEVVEPPAAPARRFVRKPIK